MNNINTIQQTDYSNDVTVLEISCPWCGKISELKVNTKIWLDGLRAYKNGALIQNAWPTLSPSDRELIKTGICDTCWNKM